MRRILVFLALSLGVLLVYNQQVVAATGLEGHRIVIDAGHGGTESGSMECFGLPEKIANLDIAYKLRALLEANGATVYMTRTDDSTMDNAERYAFANSTDGEVLVSIHLNGSTDHSINGTMSLYTKPWKDKDFTATIHKDILVKLGVDNLGITNFMSGVTLKFNGPAALLEPVYISNTQECGALIDGQRQDEIAEAIYNGLNNWFAGTIVEVFKGKNH